MQSGLLNPKEGSRAPGRWVRLWDDLPILVLRVAEGELPTTEGMRFCLSRCSAPHMNQHPHTPCGETEAMLPTLAYGHVLLKHLAVSGESAEASC